MAPSLSRSQIDALGERLARSRTPTPADLASLSILQNEYAGTLESVGRALREEFGPDPTFQTVAVAVTERIRTPNTLVEKLGQKTSLSSMQDVVGIRIVGDFSLTVQNELAARLRAMFDETKLVDRRVSPTHGYRAVHVIVREDRVPVEIQLRTLYQHVWADAMERLADTWGRGIRYGWPPLGADTAELERRARAVEQWKVVSAKIALLEQELDKLTETIADRIAEAVMADPLRDPIALSQEIMTSEPSLLAGVNAASAGLRAALGEGGVTLSALMLASLEKFKSLRHRR